MAKLQLEDVSRIYNQGKPNEVRALEDVSLTINEGEYVAIHGPSGSGKSTLLKIMGLVDTPSYGTYDLEQNQVCDLSKKERNRILAEKIGLVFQKFNLIKSLTALENVDLGIKTAEPKTKKAETQNRANEALGRIGISGTQKTEAYPSELSGGEQQRVAIARAFAKNPGIVLADEPTGSLDTEKGAEVLDVFDDLHREGETLIVVTHDPQITERASRTIELRDGSIVQPLQQGGSND